MRTTMNIDDDVLRAAKELARHRKKTAGQVLSELARLALTSCADSRRTGVEGEPDEDILGFRPFASSGGLVTNELVDRLRDEEGE